jgi:hypothetical protein
MAFLFLNTTFFWAGCVLFCNAFVRLQRMSDADYVAAAEVQRKTQEMLRRVLNM